MRGIGIFIEPKGQLLKELLEKKDLLESLMPRQSLTTAPPHCTLVHGKYRGINKWLQSLRSEVSKTIPFEIATDGWQEFPEDLMTGRGHTIAFRIKPSRKLASLQTRIATILAEHIADNETQHPLKFKEPFASSIKKYGSAFIGPHWVPHFTIGSPRVKKSSRLICLIKRGQTKHKFLLKDISIWATTSKKYRRIYIVPLANQIK
jgi:hypothetical protein